MKRKLGDGIVAVWDGYWLILELKNSKIALRPKTRLALEKLIMEVSKTA